MADLRSECQPMSDRPFLQTQVLMEVQRACDGKKAFIDPIYVAGVEPGEPTSSGEETTQVRLYALGGTIDILGEAEANAYAIQRSRGLMNELALDQLADDITDEFDKRYGTGLARRGDVGLN